MDDRSPLPPYVPQARAERLIARTRLLLAGYALAAGVVTDMQRDPRGPLALSLLATWALLAAAIWMRSRSGRRIGAAGGAAIVVIDLLVTLGVIASSGGAVSAFFPLIVLPFFAVSLLYGRRVIAWMGLVGVAAYLAVSFATPDRSTHPRLFVMRIGFLLIIATSVLQRNEFDVRTRSDALKLAAWPRPAALERDAFVATLLAHAADVLRAPRVLLAWGDVEGREWLVSWTAGAVRWLDPPPGGARSMVAPPLAGASFLSRDAGAPSPDALCFDGRTFAGYRGAIVDAAIVRRFAVQEVVSVCFVSEMVEGRLFFLDRTDGDSDDLTLAVIVARLFGSAIEQMTLLESLRRTTAIEERMRLSRDLHDTSMQSMAALALQIDAAGRLIGVDAAAAERRLASAVEQLEACQHTLRAFVDHLRPGRAASPESLRTRLARIAADITAQWGVAATVVEAPEPAHLPETLANEVCHIVAEALANAARHASATRALARVTSASGEVRIQVEDDGRGFPFHGRHDLRALVAQDRGPWSLKERVLSLGGTMTIDSSDRGSRIDIAVPIQSSWSGKLD